MQLGVVLVLVLVLVILVVVVVVVIIHCCFVGKSVFCGHACIALGGKRDLTT